MSGYSNGSQSKDVVTVTVSGTTAAGNIVGPAGKTGRVTGITARNTVALTTNPAVVTLQAKGGGDSYGKLNIPVSAIDAVASDFTVDDTSNTPTDVGRIPADAILELVSDGGPVAGAAEISVFIEWS